MPNFLFVPTAWFSQLFTQIWYSKILEYFTQKYFYSRPKLVLKNTRVFYSRPRPVLKNTRVFYSLRRDHDRSTGFSSPSTVCYIMANTPTFDFFSLRWVGSLSSLHTPYYGEIPPYYVRTPYVRSVFCVRTYRK